MPPSEEEVYEYVRDLREHHKPASRARSFLEALALASSILGFSMQEVTHSSRIRGAVAANRKTKVRGAKCGLAVEHVTMHDPGRRSRRALALKTESS